MEVPVDTDPATLSGLPAERPLVAVALAAVVATVAYLGIQVVLAGQIDVIETAAFAIVFAGVYAAFLYIRRQLVAE